MTTRGNSATYPEWTDLHVGMPLRQGDVLSSVGRTPDPWRQHLVVLTADCDLARAKHGGALTCVPVLTYTDYLLSFKYDKLRDALCDRLVGQLLDTHARGADQSRETPRISAPRMRAWIAEADVDKIISTLKLHGEPAQRFGSLAKALRELQVNAPTSLTDASKLLAQARLALGEARDADRALRSVMMDLASTMKVLPGDALFLNELSAQHAEGYIAYLRRIVEVGETSVSRSSSRISHDASYLRISRLRSPYVYALSQQFGAVFSSIGLPVEYEVARDALIERAKMRES
jgi:hypothetical protein